MDNDLEIKGLQSKLDKAFQEIIGLKGIVAALLSKTHLTDKQLKEWITRISKNPVGISSSEDAIACAENILEETQKDRTSNDSQDI